MSELFDFNIFMELSAEFGPYGFEKSESPDFLVQKDGKIIGFEHTTVVRTDNESVEIEKTGVLNGICRRCFAKIKEVSRCPVDVRAHLNFNNFHNKIPHKKVVSDLCDIIERLIASVPNDMKSHRIDVDSMPYWINALYVAKYPDWGYCHWNWDGAGWVVKDVTQYIQRAIDKKQNKIVNYRERCEIINLLLCAGHGPHNFMHPDEDSLSERYVSSADRIFFLDLGLRQVHELKCGFKPKMQS